MAGKIALTGMLLITLLAPQAFALRVPGVTDTDVGPEESCGATTRDDPDGGSSQTTTCFTGANAESGDLASARAGREEACARDYDPGSPGRSTRTQTCRDGIVVYAPGGGRAFLGTQVVVIERCQGGTCSGGTSTDFLLEVVPQETGPSYRFKAPLPVGLLP